MGDRLPFEGEPIAPVHVGRLKRVFAAEKKRAWCYYGPFICCYSLPPKRQVFLHEREGSLWLLVLRSDPAGAQIDLLVPPLPFSVKALISFADELGSVNQRPLRILWVDEEDAGRLPRTLFSIKSKEKEYFYDPVGVAAASGRAYRDLRKRLNRFQRSTQACFREMKPEDVGAGIDLLRLWRRKRRSRLTHLLDWGYSLAALNHFEDWSQVDLRGWCVEIEGRLSGLAMVGEMQDDLANFFIAKTDPDVRGLSEYLRWEVFRSLSHYRLVNDAGDLGLAGLRQYKRKFRPVDCLQVYTAEVR